MIYRIFDRIRCMLHPVRYEYRVIWHDYGAEVTRRRIK